MMYFFMNFIWSMANSVYNLKGLLSGLEAICLISICIWMYWLGIQYIY